jgi:hypothetical protein
MYFTHDAGDLEGTTIGVVPQSRLREFVVVAASTRRGRCHTVNLEGRSRS